jgi:hypothetical protein
MQSHCAIDAQLFWEMFPSILQPIDLELVVLAQGVDYLIQALRVQVALLPAMQCHVMDRAAQFQQLNMLCIERRIAHAHAVRPLWDDLHRHTPWYPAHRHGTKTTYLNLCAALPVYVTPV